MLLFVVEIQIETDIELHIRHQHHKLHNAGRS